VRVCGKGLEHKYFWVATRTDAPKDGYIKTGTLDYGLYGPEMTILVGPSKPITGTVRDRATGKPLAGIMVQEANHNISRAFTDARGQYRLAGVPKKEFYSLTAAGMSGLPYFDHFHQLLLDTAGFEPLTVDFALDRGMEISGRVLDGPTGKPVAGNVHYGVSEDNPHLKDFPVLKQARVIISDWGRIRPDGTYTVLAIPGPGAIAVCADRLGSYPILSAERELRKWKVLSHPTDSVHAVLPVDVDVAKPESQVRNVELRAGKSRAGMVVGPNGMPLMGVHAAGLVPGGKPTPMAAPAFVVTGLSECKRILVFLHAEKKLGSVAEVSADSPGMITVKLQPLGSFEGSILDGEGKPWAGLTVTCRPEIPREEYDNLPQETTTFQGVSAIHRGLWTRFLERQVTTDKGGKFRLEGIMPGVSFALAVSDGDLEKDRTLVALWRRVQVEAGKTRNLGELKKGEGVRE
jgi:hypothetical protein